MAQSPFGRALQSLLDETNLFSRTQWTEVLGVSEARIDEWVSDKEFPNPEVLRMLVDCLEISDARKEPLDEFKKLYAKRLNDVALPVHVGLQYLQSFRLGEYILLPVLEGFLRNLKTLPLKTQEKLLFQFAEECRQHSTENLKPVSREDAEKALARLAEINGVGIEEMRRRMNKISEDALRDINELGNLSNGEIINRINAYQKNTLVHPLTCGKKSSHALLEPREEDGRVILVCPTCHHKQINWPIIILWT